MPAVLEYNIIG